MSSSNCCFLTCIQISREAGRVVCYSHLLCGTIHGVAKSQTWVSDWTELKYETCMYILCIFIENLFLYICIYRESFPDSSVDKESTCNARDPGSIPGLGRFPGEGIGYPLQYSWASLMAQLVENPPAMREIWVWFLGWEDPLAKEKSTHSSILAWRIPGIVHGLQRVEHKWVTFSI